MIHAPLSSFTGLREERPLDLSVAASRTPASAEFLSLLGDARYHFPPEDQEALCQWVGPLLHHWAGWPDGVQLQWDDSLRAPASTSLDPHTEWVLHLRPGVQSDEGRVQSGLHVEWEPAPGASAACDARRPADSFTPQPCDLFDALARAATDHWSARSRVSVQGFHVDGMQLRQTLLDRLQTPDGREWGMPALTRPSTPVSPRPPAREAFSLFRPWAQTEEGPSPSKRQTLVVVPRQPTPPVEAVGEVIRTLRSGEWNEALEHVVPSLVTRLPVEHPLYTCHVKVVRPGRSTTYGPPQHAGANIQIHREDDGTLVRSARSMQPIPCEAGPDAFLQQLYGCAHAAGRSTMPRLREQLAELVACNPLLVRVGLALCERKIPGDQEVLQRLCLINRNLTIAGQQLLDPGSAQRDVQIDDLVRWYSVFKTARQRAPERLRSDGISILDAHRYAGPLRPTREGQDWLKKANQPPVNAAQADAMSLFEEQLPVLRHALKTLNALTSYLAIGARTYHRLVSGDLKDRVEKFGTDQAEADLLVLPPASPPLNPPRSTSCT